MGTAVRTRRKNKLKGKTTCCSRRRRLFTIELQLVLVTMILVLVYHHCCTTIFSSTRSNTLFYADHHEEQLPSASSNLYPHINVVLAHRIQRRKRTPGHPALQPNDGPGELELRIRRPDDYQQPLDTH